MRDPRLQKLAKMLLEYSNQVEAGTTCPNQRELFS